MNLCFFFALLLDEGDHAICNNNSRSLNNGIGVRISDLTDKIRLQLNPQLQDPSGQERPSRSFSLHSSLKNEHPSALVYPHHLPVRGSLQPLLADKLQPKDRPVLYLRYHFTSSRELRSTYQPQQITL